MRRSVRVLLVDDYAPIREYVRSTLQGHPELHVVAEAADGLEAIASAQELKPDLILLDIGLPTLNGIEAARRIRKVSPDSRIIFLTEIRAWSFAEEALRSGASGYVVKSDAAGELLSAVEAALKGTQFVSSSITERDIPEPPGITSERHHEAGFFTGDQFFLDHVTDFVGTTLKAGNTAVIAATEPHRNSILERLAATHLDIDKAVDEGRYLALDADEAVSKIVVRGRLDRDRVFSLFTPVLDKASRASRGKQGRIGAFGEIVNVLCARGNPDAAIDLEICWNRLMEKYNMHLLCGYSFNGLHEVMNGQAFQRIRDAHSAVHFH